MKSDKQSSPLTKTLCLQNVGAFLRSVHKRGPLFMHSSPVKLTFEILEAGME